MNTIRQ